MKLAKSTGLPKKHIIILVAVLGVIVVVGIGGWLFSRKVAADYNSQLGSSVLSIKKEIVEQAAPLESSVKEGDSAKASESLQKLEESLQKRASELPTTPSLWGVKVADQQDTQRRDELITAMQSLADNLRQSRELLLYGHAVTTTLQEVTTKTGGNAEQQKALAQAWQAAITKLQDMKPPSAAESVHGQIIQAATKAQAGLALLPDLFTKKDIPGFAAKQKEIEGAITELRSIGPSIIGLIMSQDESIGQKYQNLIKLL